MNQIYCLISRISYNTEIYVYVYVYLDPIVGLKVNLGETLEPLHWLLRAENVYPYPTKRILDSE